MYMVGSYIVSTLSGMRFADFVSRRIFKPLSMNSSTYSIDAAVNTGRFTSTWTSFGRLIPHWLQDEFADLVAGPGGVISSVEELARHVFWSTWHLTYGPRLGTMGQNASEWWCRPRHKCDNYPTRRFRGYHFGA
jgi:CubicO group peptidase (beta-lactamase class C family)